jgi:uncharacterized lipoprotein YehR (DUF1307 family)
MTVYKVSFSNNKIISVTISTTRYHFEGAVYTYASNNRLVFALIKAESPEDAQKTGEELIRQFYKNLE